ncbi:copper homeostasis protein CutC [Vibrio ziniensis]|uniref:PF03932 family protein CutC n=1 Tax=Vibrio ziniensis TaxID=2711221 RepID=A0A6G7CG84_9VIBR|nr:copper homeostasis protein CutC [Vibrio ziniensis]QIH41048.1 copper homeostasis protein CutC [Vibrio ziniensis]
MNYNVEVCIDNLESLHLAIEGGANRIELCSSLALGGLTPSFGMMKQAAKLSTIPVYAMIRPRQGDFLYDEDDVESMLYDIDAAAEAGLQGIVFGILTAEGSIDMNKCARIVNHAKLNGLGVTFHRAIDQCHNHHQALENIIELGCERVLTSGLASNALAGVDVIAEMVQLAKGRVSIMAGAGVSSENVEAIVTQTLVKEVHLSGKSTRTSHMKLKANAAKMGNQNLDDFIVPVTDPEAIRKVANIIKSL